MACSPRPTLSKVGRDERASLPPLLSAPLVSPTLLPRRMRAKTVRAACDRRPKPRSSAGTPVWSGWHPAVSVAVRERDFKGANDPGRWGRRVTENRVETKDRIIQAALVSDRSVTFRRRPQERGTRFQAHCGPPARYIPPTGNLRPSHVGSLPHLPPPGHFPLRGPGKPFPPPDRYEHKCFFSNRLRAYPPAVTAGARLKATDRPACFRTFGRRRKKFWRFAGFPT